MMLLLGFFVKAQDIAGDWSGKLEVQGMSLSVIFHITADGENYTATMDSPDQGANGIPVSGVSFEQPNLSLDLAAIGGKYTGVVSNNYSEIEGTLFQGGQEVPLNLKKTNAEAIAEDAPKRPQVPKEPYPYYTEDLVFKNKTAGIELAGTLTLPDADGQYPVVVLISGSGPQNRDEELMNHKPFLVLADYLTRHGIGVLRYDDRGIAESGGDFKTATSADFATDAYAAVQYLQTRKEVIKDKIGLAGHSEGGMIAPMVAAEHPEHIDFIVLMAGPGTKIIDLLIEQMGLLGTAQGATPEEIAKNSKISRNAFEIMEKEQEVEKQEVALRAYLNTALSKEPKEDLEKMGGLETTIEKQMAALANPWFRFFITYHPAENLQQVKCPVLAINGTKDLQVASASNLAGIKQALEAGGNTQFEIVALEDLNHLFQKCETGAIAEYAQIEETMNLTALKTIADWIISNCSN